MLLDLAAPAAPASGAPFMLAGRSRWGVDSEYGLLTDVMIAAPDHLEVVPCNAVSRGSVAAGLDCCPDLATRQHAELVRTLIEEGVRCHIVPAAARFADLCFTRDSTFMTPWGLLELSPSVPHRADEPAYVAAAAARWGVKRLGRLDEGRAEGGDICLLRPGLVAIGWSRERTDAAGALALARLFRARGWQAILTEFDPHFLHLDTIFTMLDRHRAVACIEALEPAFRDRVQALGIALVPVTPEEVGQLGGNLLSLGAGRLLSTADNHRLNRTLTRLGYLVTTLDIDQFTRCGGGLHCLTMPLARHPG